MKKAIISILVILLVSLGAVGCGSQSSSAPDSQSNAPTTSSKTVTLDDYVKAYETEGVKIDTSDKPFFQMIGAKDGVNITFENSKVAIYEYASEKDLEKAKKDYESTVKGWPSNGKFLLEAYTDKAKEIFNNVK